LNGEDEELTSILSKFPFLVNWRSKKYKTPLHFAIEGNHLSTCELFLDFRADIYLKSSQYQVYWLTYNASTKCLILLDFSSTLLWNEL